MNSGPSVRLALDARALALDPRTTAHRIATELFPRLIKLSPFGGLLGVPRSATGEPSVHPTAADDVMGLMAEAPAADFAAGADVSVLLGGEGAAPQSEAGLKVRILAGPEVASEDLSGLDERTIVLVASRHARNRLLAARTDLGSAQVMVLPIAPKAAFNAAAGVGAQRLRSKYGLPATGRYLLGLATHAESTKLVRAFAQCLREPGCEDLSLALLDPWRQGPVDEQVPIDAVAPEHLHRIVRLPSLEDADAPELFAGALLLVHAGDSGGVETALLEAMAAGVPVMAEANGPNEELLGGCDGLLDYSDMPAVVNAWSKLASSDAMRSELSKHGRSRAGMVDWESSAVWTKGVILGVLERRRRRLVNQAYPLVPAEADPKNWGFGLDGRAIAGVVGFPNGAQGPSQFGSQVLPVAQHGPAWPRWIDRLVPPPGATGSRIEGGLRVSGRMKQGSAQRPLISFVTVVRNNKATLERTIQSVQRQTYDNVEHIVLDGASTDGTVELIQSHAQRLDYFVSEPDRGLYDALNKAIPLARGQLICVLNSDDWLEPCAAEIAARRLMGRRDALIVMSGAAVEADKQVIEWYPAVLHPGCYFACANDCHNAVYATPAAYEKTGPYDTSYKIAADFKWLMTCVDRDVPAVYTREITVNYSLGGTSGDVRAHSLECCRVVAQRFPALSPQEVHGLYHCFFALGVDKPSLVPDRPADADAFLKQVATRHAQDPSFMTALAWAMLHAARPVAALAAPDPQAAPATPGVRAASRQWVRAVLHRYPRLARAANRVRSHVGRGA